jgi:hypothetical protein
MPDQLYHLSEFTLVLLDIATTSPSWFAQQKQQARAAAMAAMFRTRSSAALRPSVSPTKQSQQG